MEPNLFPNLRNRPSLQPWEVEVNQVTALVREVEKKRIQPKCVDLPLYGFWSPLQKAGVPPPPPCDPEPKGSRIALEIALDIPVGARLLGVKSTHPEDKLEPLKDTESGKGARWKLEFFAPELDQKIHNRDPVVLQVEYEFEGKRKTEDLAVDYRFLMGYQLGDPAKDVTAFEEARILAEIAQRHRKDAAIQKLLRRANTFKKGSIREEVARLKKMLGFESRDYYVSDPPSDIERGVEHYALAPTETLRYGGDCEDLAALAGAYFSGRGFRTEVAVGLHHAWAVVEGERVDLTQTEDPKPEDYSMAMSSAAVPAEPAAPTAPPKPLAEKTPQHRVQRPKH